MHGQSDLQTGFQTRRKPVQAFKGVLVPALSPFKGDLSLDEEAMLAFCRWLLEQGADGLAIFGTTSEANSLSLAERTAMIERLIEGGIPAGRLMPGTGACNIPKRSR